MRGGTQSTITLPVMSNLKSVMLNLKLIAPYGPASLYAPIWTWGKIKHAQCYFLMIDNAEHYMIHIAVKFLKIKDQTTQ